MIKEIHLHNFRNYIEERISFDEGINVFLGKNGQGKTNLLEAVYLLGMLSSFRKADAGQMINKGAPFFSVKGLFEGDEATTLAVERDHRGWRHISADGGACRRKTDYIGKIRMVVFSPDEMALIQGSPDGRRRYLDRTFFNLKRRHLSVLKAYNRVLRQRNLLLKRGRCDAKELGAWSERLAKEGAEVVKGRIEMVALLNSELEKRYSFLGEDEASLSYETSGYSLENGSGIEEALLDRLRQVQKEELMRKVTLAGPHRDDVLISMNGVPAKAFSSRGEMRSILLALKVAEVEIYRSLNGADTLILLDDVASELDVERRENLLAYLRAQGEQVLITTTEEENIPHLKASGNRVFRVERGKILH